MGNHIPGRCTHEPDHGGHSRQMEPAGLAFSRPRSGTGLHEGKRDSSTTWAFDVSFWPARDTIAAVLVPHFNAVTKAHPKRNGGGVCPPSVLNANASSRRRRTRVGNSNSEFLFAVPGGASETSRGRIRHGRFLHSSTSFAPENKPIGRIKDVISTNVNAGDAIRGGHHIVRAYGPFTIGKPFGPEGPDRGPTLACGPAQ